MRKESFFVVISVCAALITFCVIYATVGYTRSLSQPKAVVSLGGSYVTYEVPVISSYEACMKFLRMKSDWSEAQHDFNELERCKIDARNKAKAGIEL